jgi:KDO2-lipid IV(A) lauroyltransferase
MLGRFCYHVLGRYRDKAVYNLRLIYGDTLDRARARAITREVFGNLGMNLAEFVYMPRLNKARMSKLIYRVDGFDYAKKAVELGKGLIVVTGHLGNWELLPAYFGMQGYPVNVIARDVRNPELQKVALRLRESHGVRCVSRERALRFCIGALKRNEVVGILADQHIDSLEGVYVDFMGRPAYTIAGPVALARLYDTPIIVARIIREGRRHRIEFLPPLELVKTKDHEADILENTTRYTQLLERFVREFPAQWVWFHDRWREKK